MNYAGSFNATLLSNAPGTPGHIQVLDVPHAHAPANAIVVPDAHFLFNADFKRAGVDLVLFADGREVVLHDYFRGETRAPLASPDGAHLTGDIVKALTSYVQVSQADGTAASAGKVIGHVTKLQGTATAVRNGVAIILHQGDNVEKGDVVQSGSDSTLGITFIDGTVFGLSSNARMVLNEMVYDPNGSNNSSLMSLVAGTISFVAGETAKHGDMKVDTPVATMGIRGTAVLVEIDFTVPGQNSSPDAKFQVLVEPDGHTGSYVLFDKTTLQPITVVNQAGQQVNISNGVVSQTNSPLPPDIQKLITDVFSLKFTDNNNPKSTTHFTDIGVIDTLAPIKVASGATAIPIFSVTPSTETTQNAPSNSSQHQPGPPKATVLDSSGKVATAFTLTELAGKTGDAATHDLVGGSVNFVDVNPGDQPSVSVKFGSFAYHNAQQADVTSGLSALQLQDIVATEIKVGVVQDASSKNFGSASWTYSIADNAFDFLAAGESLTLTYIVRVDNNYAPSNEFTEIPITITVTGTNDAPVVTTSAQAIAFSGGTSVAGGPLTSSGGTGAIHFHDVDLTDRPTAAITAQSVTWTAADHTDLSGALTPEQTAAFEHALVLTQSGNINDGTVDWSYSIADSALGFLGQGQAVTIKSTVTVDDHHGGTVDVPVTVTINGANGAPVIQSEDNPAHQIVVLSHLSTETFDGVQTGSASDNGQGHGTFYSAPLHAWFTASGDAGVVNGASDVSAPPLVGTDAGHADATNYLSIGAQAQETITFDGLQNSFSLYWGSVDSYNLVSFYHGDQLVASYTGDDVKPLLAIGDQNSLASNGLVAFQDIGSFDKVVLASSQAAFELDDVSSGFTSHAPVKLGSPIAGTLTVSDTGVGDSLTGSVLGDAVIKYNGSTELPSGLDVSALIDQSAIKFDSVTSDGKADVLQWTYAPTDTNLDFLKPGDTLSVTYQAQVGNGHDVSATQALTINITGSGDSTLFGTSNSETFNDVGGGVTIFGNGGDDTFVFNAQFGSATIADFNVDKDAIEVDHSLFASVSAILAGAQSANSGVDIVITDASHDTITLKNVTLAQLQAHQHDFHII